MKLQNIVFPKPGVCCDLEMFFRLVPQVDPNKVVYRLDMKKQQLSVDRSGCVFFDTYFNGLSVGKWMKYTSVSGFALTLDLKGRFSVYLLHNQYVNGVIAQHTLDVVNVTCAERTQVRLEFPKCEPDGAISFRLDSLEDGSCLYGGYYSASACSVAPHTVKLALNICNFNREAYIYRNFGILQKYIYLNPDSQLRENLCAFIADNSGTLDRERLPEGDIFVFPQGDFGGAGGFARGLIEVLAVKKKYRLTHVVMMDDDILIEPESLERLYSFLCYLKEEYQTAFVGGALLRLDLQNVQCINGGEWDLQKYYIMHKIGANLSNLADVLKNEIEDGAKINGWWFHCLPLGALSTENLPYPFFFHVDDVEYDLRNCKQVITLNGICVWHEPFEYKPGSHLSYYNTRNMLIVQMLHYDEPANAKTAVSMLSREFFPRLWIYRYKEAALVLRGVEDALKGPEWLMAQNPEQLLEDVLAEGYRKQSLDKLSMRFDYGQYLFMLRGGAAENRRGWRLRRLTLNGYLRRANHDAIIPMDAPLIRTTYCARQVLNYDPITDRGYITKKSYKECFRLLLRYVRTRRLIRKQFDSAKSAYRAHFSEMTSASFWRRYLGIGAAPDAVSDK